MRAMFENCIERTRRSKRKLVDLGRSN